MTRYLLVTSQLQKDSSENSKEENLLNWEREVGTPGMFDLDGLRMGCWERFCSEQSGRKEDRTFPSMERVLGCWSEALEKVASKRRDQTAGGTTN